MLGASCNHHIRRCWVPRLLQLAHLLLRFLVDLQSGWCIAGKRLGVGVISLGLRCATVLLQASHPHQSPLRRLLLCEDRLSLLPLVI